MPIIYSKQKIQMTPLQDITPEDFEAFKMHHKKFEYSTADSMDLVNLVRKYIYDAPSCMTCTSTLREIKTNCNEFYLANKDKIELILAERSKPKHNEENKKKK